GGGRCGRRAGGLGRGVVVGGGGRGGLCRVVVGSERRGAQQGARERERQWLVHGIRALVDGEIIVAAGPPPSRPPGRAATRVRGPASDGCYHRGASASWFPHRACAAS